MDSRKFLKLTHFQNSNFYPKKPSPIFLGGTAEIIEHEEACFDNFATSWNVSVLSVMWLISHLKIYGRVPSQPATKFIDYFQFVLLFNLLGLYATDILILFYFFFPSISYFPYIFSQNFRKSNIVLKFYNLFI